MKYFAIRRNTELIESLHLHNQ